MKNESTVNELLALQNRIEEAKGEKASIEGELKSLLTRLKEEFGTDKVPDVERKLVAMKTQADKLRRQVEEGLVVLRKEMEG
jgi:predicted  nucleic acid-binding Zn-ribbon protein